MTKFSKELNIQNKEVRKLVDEHKQLTHSENLKIISHVQRELDDWFVNTLMMENIDVPFKYKRKKLYKSLKGQRINITYYPDIEKVAGFDMEIMRIVRIKIS